MSENFHRTFCTNGKARVKRRTSHEPNLMLMRNIHCSPSFALGSADVKYGVWPGPKRP